MAVADLVKTFTFYEILVGMKATITVFIQRIILRNRKAITLQYNSTQSCWLAGNLGSFAPVIFHSP